MLSSKKHSAASPQFALTVVLQRLFAHSATAGLVLLCAALAALALANSEFSDVYQDFLHASLTLGVGNWQGGTTVAHAINDGLMAIFFLLVTLEIKREVLEGELSTRAQALLPCVAAFGGVIAPAILYAALTAQDATALRGWAIPTATDIAFSLGVLSLLGSRVPLSLKIFLTTLAVVDDLVAIVVIALFYTAQIDFSALTVAAGCLMLLVLLRRFRVFAYFPYILVGAGLWWLVLQSGVHATLAGVALGLFIPHTAPDEDGDGVQEPMLVKMEHFLQPWVAFIIMPLFAFANAGLVLDSSMFEYFFNPITLGVLLGLVVGKPLGIGLAVALCVWRGWASLPRGANWGQMMAIASLAGIGFTMSLFINHLAFNADHQTFADLAKLGVLVGSALSVLVGCLLIWASPAKNN